MTVSASHATKGIMLSDVFFLAVGLLMLARGDLFARRAARKHEARLAELRAGGQERFFEERRSLEAYPPFAKPRTWRILGGLLAAVMVASLVIGSL